MMMTMTMRLVDDQSDAKNRNIIHVVIVVAGFFLEKKNYKCFCCHFIPPPSSS